MVLRAVLAVLAGLALLVLSFMSVIWGPALVSGGFRLPIWAATTAIFTGFTFAGLVVVRLWPGICMMIVSDKSDDDLRVEEQRRWFLIRRSFRVTDGLGKVVARIECLSSASVGRAARWNSSEGLELMCLRERRGRSFARRGVQAVDELLPIAGLFGGLTRLLTLADWYRKASELVFDVEDAQGQRIGTMVLVQGEDHESTIDVEEVDARWALAIMATVASDRIG